MHHYDDPTTPHPSKKRIRLTSDDKHILIPLSNASGPIQILKIALADLQPLPLVPVDRQWAVSLPLNDTKHLFSKIACEFSSVIDLDFQ